MVTLDKTNISFFEGKGHYRVFCDVSLIGSDLVVRVYGGEKPHVGAVAIGIPRPSLANDTKVSASVSVITLTGHKEDELAKNVAEKLSAVSNRVTVVTVGIHIDNITSSGIKTIESNFDMLLNKLLNYYNCGS